jgi:hypothetical protein
MFSTLSFTLAVRAIRYLRELFFLPNLVHTILTVVVKQRNEAGSVSLVD